MGGGGMVRASLAPCQRARTQPVSGVELWDEGQEARSGGFKSGDQWWERRWRGRVRGVGGPSPPSSSCLPPDMVNLVPPPVLRPPPPPQKSHSTQPTKRGVSLGVRQQH